VGTGGEALGTELREPALAVSAHLAGGVVIQGPLARREALGALKRQPPLQRPIRAHRSAVGGCDGGHLRRWRRLREGLFEQLHHLGLLAQELVANAQDVVLDRDDAEAPLVTVGTAAHDGVDAADLPRPCPVAVPDEKQRHIACREEVQETRLVVAAGELLALDGMVAEEDDRLLQRRPAQLVTQPQEPLERDGRPRVLRAGGIPADELHPTLLEGEEDGALELANPGTHAVPCVVMVAGDVVDGEG